MSTIDTRACIERCEERRMFRIYEVNKEGEKINLKNGQLFEPKPLISMTVRKAETILEQLQKIECFTNITRMELSLVIEHRKDLEQFVNIDKQ